MSNHKFVICLKGTQVFAGVLTRSPDVDYNGTFTTHLENAVLLHNGLFPDPLYAATLGPEDVFLTDVLPAVMLSCVETILVCTDSANIEFTRALKLQ